MNRRVSKPFAGAVWRRAGTLGCVLSAGLLWAAAPSATGAVASVPKCASKAMYVVAHEDDSLLFQSPDLLRDIRNGRCVQTVFLTAGDDGKGESYWITREEGAEAAYAQMAGVADSWTPSTETANGQSILLETLDEQPRVSVLFMRLPDGGYPQGEGTSPKFESLMKLWSASEAKISTVEEKAPATYTATYDRDGLIETLAEMMTNFEPQWIATQNYDGTFIQPNNPDHPDHVATAKFTKEAQGHYLAPHQLLGYEDYETSTEDPNVSGELLEAKEAAFVAYEEHDEACTEGSECKAQYQGWLERQYVVAEELIGDPTPTAVAGSAQSVASSALVTLNGSASVNPYRQPLEYKWTQTAGPAVSLAHAASASPSFTAPVGPASLTFSLVVSNAAGSSPPSTVAVAVTPPPLLPPSAAPPTASSELASAPAFTTPGTRYGIVGRRLGFAVRAAGVPAPVLALSGPHPADLRLEGLGPGAATLSGRLRKAGRFHLTVLAQNSAAGVRQRLTLVVRCPKRSGARGARTHRRSPSRSPRSRSCGGRASR